MADGHLLAPAQMRFRTPTTLLILPREIRDQIWGYVLHDREKLYVNKLHPLSYISRA